MSKAALCSRASGSRACVEAPSAGRWAFEAHAVEPTLGVVERRVDADELFLVTTSAERRVSISASRPSFVSPIRLEGAGERVERLGGVAVGGFLLGGLEVKRHGVLLG